ncbi:alanine racemase [Phenylobacterium sp. Root700]|uniref:alanine racemase n=1 Tax=Phenylobacterium sp. Root700 TaxID=1736591 RepID=UPI0006FBE5ED|nr:alanine racemase [Phenylobacterium sp. Root700]KRB44467.1 alanine racemase [Phenylobacterium sp. Root700]
MIGAGCEVADDAGGCLVIDLAAIRANYAFVAGLVAPSPVAGVVKADAYGLGAVRVARVLAEEGCGDFFVAHLSEALHLKPSLPQDARLYVLNGLQPGAEARCAAAGVLPVLNSMEQAMAWRDLALAERRRLPALLQIDSGMSRLGLPPEDVARLAETPGFFDQVEIKLVMSHLACADAPEAAANGEQLARFERLAAMLPPLPRSFANSGGAFAAPKFHGGLVRPGLALYGANPVEDAPNPLARVVRLDARVIQIRTIPAGTGVGYGLTFTAPDVTRLATVSVGYADGWPRQLGGRGAAYFGDVRLPIVGRVSMDSMILDVTALTDGALKPGDAVELIGPHQSLEDVARDAGTITYEILTSLGRRYARTYLDEAQTTALEINA